MSWYGGYCRCQHQQTSLQCQVQYVQWISGPFEVFKVECSAGCLMCSLQCVVCSVCNRAPQNNFLPLSHLKCSMKVQKFLFYEFKTKKKLNIFMFTIKKIKKGKKHFVFIHKVPINLLPWQKLFSLTENFVDGRNMFLWQKLFICDRSVFPWRKLRHNLISVIEICSLKDFFSLSEIYHSKNLFLWHQLFFKERNLFRSRKVSCVILLVSVTELIFLWLNHAESLKNCNKFFFYDCCTISNQ